MWRARRLITLLGVGAAAAFAALVLPMASAHAASDPMDGGPYETCDGAVCLVMGPLTRDSFEGPDKVWTYGGVRPMFTQWKADDGQLYNVQATDGDSKPIDAGSYDIKISDTWTPLVASYVYQYGDFVANPDAPADLDLGWFGDLSGATVYKTVFGDITSTTISNVGPHDASYWVFSTPDFTNTVVTGDGGSAAYIQFGDSEPAFLWNSLFHPGLLEAQVPDYLIPSDPFSSIDFDPCDFVGGCSAPM